ncbi:aminotransferase class IV [Ruegeria atlantica]|uniref:aminotransferase class IV n=1 Tax=Ruegeria atlantica TaxID=81569 RepID=UPI0014799959|nr:aminotransferase class IV [Ruegeria atlantica]
MSRTVWLNGTYMPAEKAQLPIFDRGLLFADAVYEGFGVLDGQIIDFPSHMQRLKRSLTELEMQPPMSEAALFDGLMGLIARNAVEEAFLYLHVTRGAHDRDYLYPGGLSPNVFAFTQPLHGGLAADPPQPLRLASAPDIRWARRDIKTSNLLGQVLAKEIARKAGADEALMIAPDGTVTECGAMSFFIVRNGCIHARPLSRDILPGITRQTMLRVADDLGLKVVDATYTLDDVFRADEAFATGASSYVQPVPEVDGRQIGDGETGTVTTLLRREYLKAVRASFRHNRASLQ